MDTLVMLHKGSPKLRKALLTDPDIIQLLSTCALNVLKGNLTIKNNHKEKLRRHRKSLHTLSKKTTPLSKKRKLLQTGGRLVKKLVEAVAEEVAESIGEALASAFI